MIVSVTIQRIPSFSISGRNAASTESITKVPHIGAYMRATPRALDSCPSSRNIRSAGPFNAAPPMMGEIATTDSRR
jgi:hypothetical protein